MMASRWEPMDPKNLDGVKAAAARKPTGRAAKAVTGVKKGVGDEGSEKGGRRH